MSITEILNFDFTRWLRRCLQPAKPALILVVEDHNLAKECIENAAKAEMVPVLVVKRAEAAIKELQTSGEKYAAAVIDVMLPDMNGWTLCKIIAEKWPELKIVVISIDARNFESAPAGKPITVFRKNGRRYAELFQYLKRELKLE